MAKQGDRPNLLFIFTDQQHARMMSCAGNAYVRTPATDSLAERGVRFERCYCAEPVCVPSRFALMTGRMPTAIGLRGNRARWIDDPGEPVVKGGAGHVVARGGYRCYYGGKQHLPRLTAERLGFEVIERDERDGLAMTCADFLLGYDRPEPFFLVASFINPHDICYMAIRDSQQTDFERLLVRKGETELAELDRALALPEGMDEEAFFAERCPPLPPNFEPQADEPEAYERMLERAPFRVKARRGWDERRWRLHRWAYARLTERVDTQIGGVLDALHRSGLDEKTVVIFSSDHGDMDGSHRLEHKTAFYEEAANVPLIVAGPGIDPAGRVDRAHVLSNGLDLLPTLCDYAAVEAPGHLIGQSFRPLAERRAATPPRTFVPMQNEDGDAIVTERYKYCLFHEGERREQVYDLKTDPHEMRNAVGDVDAATLEALRGMFVAVDRGLAAG